RAGTQPLVLRVGGDHGEHARDFYASTDSNGDTIMQRDAGEPNPSEAFTNLFGSGMQQSAEPSPRERLRGKRASVLDSVLVDFDRAMSEVGSVDRQRLERHADHIRQVERSLDAVSLIVCEDPALNLPAGMPDNFSDGDGRFDDLIA